MSEVALTVVFNHRYEQNLPRLRAYYRARFPDLTFLMPFSRSADPDVMCVYESSYRFQSYIAQSWSRHEGSGAEFFAFTGDDCLLNPALDESNLASELGLDADTAYIVEMIPLTRRRYRWPYFRQILQQAQVTEQYFLWRKELPDAAEMDRRFERHGYETGELQFALRRPDERVLGSLRDWGKFRRMRARGLSKPKFPVVTGWSDFVVVPRRHMPAFVHLCHVFSGMGLFVEAAIPTALALSCPKIRTQADSSWKATMAWGPQAREALTKPMKNSMQRIAAAFAANELLKHPVKLSSFADDIV